MTNNVWEERLAESQEKIAQNKAKRQKIKSRFINIFVLAVIYLLFIRPQYWKRLIYPHIYGTPTNQQLTISEQDSFEDLPPDTPHMYIKYDDSYTYELTPKTKYSVTGKIGYAEPYDGIWNRIYRNHSQKDYIDLVPIDFVIVIGNMAKPEIYKMFKFDHEERAGFVGCKGIKYNSIIWTKRGQRKMAEIAAKCNPFIKDEEYNNYHPIPANENIRKAFHMLLPNDVVYLEGILVDVEPLGLVTGTRKNQVHKYLIRGFNPGMCFVLYTTKIIFNNHIYE